MMFTWSLTNCRVVDRKKVKRYYQSTKENGNHPKFFKQPFSSKATDVMFGWKNGVHTIDVFSSQAKALN